MKGIKPAWALGFRASCRIGTTSPFNLEATWMTRTLPVLPAPLLAGERRSRCIRAGSARGRVTTVSLAPETAGRNPRVWYWRPSMRGSCDAWAAGSTLRARAGWTRCGMHDPDELAAKLNGIGASVLVVEVDFVFEEVFEAVPNLEFVGICRAATNHVDIEAATARRRRGRQHPGQERPSRGGARPRTDAGAGEAHPGKPQLRLGRPMAQSPGAVRRVAGTGAGWQDAGASWVSAPSDGGWRRWRPPSA